MTHAGPKTVNEAHDSAVVGVQADTVHGGVTIYQVSDADSPERRFTVGVRYLHAGVPSEARRLIESAVMAGHASSESYFYLMLALLSGRTLQHLSTEDLSILRTAREWTADQPRDRWTDAIHVINRLLESLSSPGTEDLQAIVKDFDGLGREQREAVLRNLEVFLAGPHQDWTWQRAFDAAREQRWQDDRQNRVWRFFQPEPAGPRVRWPAPVRTRLGDRIRAGATAVVFLFFAGFLVTLSWQQTWSWTLGGLLIAVGAGYLAAVAGLHRRHLMRRLRTEERRLSGAVTEGDTPRRYRFASDIDRQFRSYFGRYVPDGVDRRDWLELTRGFRQKLRDEIVEIYRESRVPAKRVAWLVRFLAADVKRQWLAGELYGYRRRLQVPVAVDAALATSIVVLVVVIPGLLWNAMQVRPFAAAGSTIIALAGGTFAVRGWAGILLERLRFAAEQAEAEESYEARVAAYRRWSRKLESRPSDAEMAQWLDSDHKALIEEAMQHYRLAPHDIIAHAFIEAPPSGAYERARVPKGPMRYSRYRLLIFLLSADGVRQMSVTLNFETGRFHDRERMNYRYDAVAAVHVIDADDGQKTLELTLLDNQSVKVAVTGPPPQTVGPGEDNRTISRVTLDAAGLGNTLHVLEGIAAEGKQWIRYEREREREGLAHLVVAAEVTLD
ncbi:hypothetical protein [Nucisporomicrobium flavum]|uniref:hypothetical protein n=1 Tax=Nucisporomicrobium flavum TaxID=2785915 RepID=UPI0018F32D6D|nr:hypothetical protein [Nucisporomicrobium flavum]